MHKHTAIPLTVEAGAAAGGAPDIFEVGGLEAQAEAPRRRIDLEHACHHACRRAGRASSSSGWNTRQQQPRQEGQAVRGGAAWWRTEAGAGGGGGGRPQCTPHTALEALTLPGGEQLSKLLHEIIRHLADVRQPCRQPGRQLSASSAPARAGRDPPPPAGSLRTAVLGFPGMHAPRSPVAAGAQAARAAHP